MDPVYLFLDRVKILQTRGRLVDIITYQDQEDKISQKKP